MRKAAGIALTCLGVIGFTICGIVLLRLPIPGVVLRHLGSFGFHVHPVEGPISSLVFLTIGILLVRRPKQAPPRECNRPDSVS
jgi:uncharacterized membrane protein YdcZ (DUF606 family)